MDKMLLGNGFFLLGCMGYQQWLICYSSNNSSKVFDVFGKAVYEELLLSQIVGFLPIIFAVLSLALPFYMIRIKQISLRNNREKAVALSITPFLFFFITHQCDCLPHSWSIAELAGPRIILNANFSPQI
jgi:hypothetical protein